VTDTDLPRRSYPLVVPPPGGFEDAVRRGRGVRRRRAGGGTGLAMLLVGALAYSVLGHGSGTASLDPAHQPIQQNVPAGDGTAVSATPTPSATGAPSPGTNQALPGSRTGGRPGSSVGPLPNATSTVRQPGPQPVPYAHRNKISMSKPFPDTNTACLGSTADWCSYATATPASGISFTLAYTLCLNVNAASNKLTYRHDQPVDFAAIDTEHNDTVWTYSAGQPVGAKRPADSVDPGYCVTWSVLWDGFDDFSKTPPPGDYVLQARSLATQTVPPASTDFVHS
jgi:hypothetical protein